MDFHHYKLSIPDYRRKNVLLNVTRVVRSAVNECLTLMVTKTHTCLVSCRVRLNHNPRYDEYLLNNAPSIKENHLMKCRPEFPKILFTMSDWPAMLKWHLSIQGATNSRSFALPDWTLCVSLTYVLQFSHLWYLLNDAPDISKSLNQGMQATVIYKYHDIILSVILSYYARYDYNLLNNVRQNH